MTPTIDEITIDNQHDDIRAILQNTVTIRGRHFSNVSQNNVIEFGKIPCHVQTSSTDTATCLIDADRAPPMNTWLPVKMSVIGKGNAFVNIMDSEKYSIIFQHSVTSIQPAQGSFGGGTLVTVKGYGLDVGTLDVRLHDPITGEENQVEIVERQYNEMKILTPSVMLSTTQKSVVKQLRIEDSTYESWSQDLGNSANLKFSYVNNYTAVMVNVTPVEYDTLDSLMTIELTSVPQGYEQKDIVVRVGGKQAEITNFTGGVITAKMPSLAKGEHPVSVSIGDLGHAYINRTLTNATVTVKPNIKEVVPSSGSIHGNQRIVVKGYGFVATMVRIRFANTYCECDNITATEAHCVTPAGTGWPGVFVVEGWTAYPGRVVYTYAPSITPTITSLNPAMGVGGETVTITGKNFAGTKDDYEVVIGKSPAQVEIVSSEQITVLLGPHRAGTESVKITVRGYGDSNKDITFLYALKVNDPGNFDSGMGGGLTINLNGRGFSAFTNVSVCGTPCSINGIPSEKMISVVSPLYKDFATATQDVSCDIKVEQGGEVTSFPAAYRYKPSLTTKINDIDPRRSGTGGGVLITIIGENFKSNADASVKIAGVECNIQSVTATQITCLTGSSSKSAMGVDVDLSFVGMGRAVPSETKFDYIDLWSSKWSWNGTDPPKEG